MLLAEVIEDAAQAEEIDRAIDRADDLAGQLLDSISDQDAAMMIRRWLDLPARYGPFKGQHYPAEATTYAAIARRYGIKSHQAKRKIQRGLGEMRANRELAPLLVRWWYRTYSKRSPNIEFYRDKYGMLRVRRIPWVRGA